MTITIKATHIELTDALRNYVEEKIGGLTKYYAEAMLADIEVGKTTNHHNKGEDIFRAEANVTAPNHLFRASAEAADLYAAIDQLKNALKQEFIRYKEKQQDKARK